MPHKGPHISISSEFLVHRVLRIPLDDFEDWPEAVRALSMELAEELFLVRYNPFIDAATVRASVREKWEKASPALAHHYANSLAEGMTMFWSAYDADMEYRQDLIKALLQVLPKDNVSVQPHALVESSTDATDLRMELPLLVVSPSSSEQVSSVVRLANEMKFALIPRGGGSGLTGGAIPARKRTVVMSLQKLSRIKHVDNDAMVLCSEAGVITADAIDAARQKGLLFTVDPASKTASTIGGNVSENSGGPFAFEYGTTLDNLLSYRMVTPTGEIIDVARKDHPRHKIMTDETAVFEVRDVSGGVRKVVSLRGDQIRKAGLGKDVTNKTLGGLPGVQKEGVDGIITEACFVLYPTQEHSRVLVLEFFGRTMHNAMLVIKQVVALRDDIRSKGDLVKLSALEEFGSKYVEAIEYQKKSARYEGAPISVLILQFDSNTVDVLEQAVRDVVEICEQYDNVDVFAAKDSKEAELFWEDRHRLSAIARRTSGFKINEDIVIPIDSIPDFSLFLEQLNLECTAQAFRVALQEAGRLQGMPMEDKAFNKAFSYASRVAQGKVPFSEISDQEMLTFATDFFVQLQKQYPALRKKLEHIVAEMLATRIVVANHMHAGDGNCHVNIPVDSNNAFMLHNAEVVAERVMAKAQEMDGEVSGEHGIGITKIKFLPQDKMEDLKEYKDLVDPRNILNPAKLTQYETPVKPFTFSFNRLIQDIGGSGLPDKERLISLLTSIQVCTRCGKCKNVCPMFYPEQGLQHHPRNKNISLGALIEAIYYSQANKGKPDATLMAALNRLMEHCTGCGKCMAVCPVKINSSDVALHLRSFVEEENSGFHPIKSRVLTYLALEPASRVPRAAKVAAFGQQMQNKVLGLVPAGWRQRMENPLFSAPGPELGYQNLHEALKLEKGSMFMPAGMARDGEKNVEAVFYFPGCGGSLFYRSIGLAGLMLLLRSGVAVVMPPKHMCCGYPLLAAGQGGQFTSNRERTIEALRAVMAQATEHGLAVSHLITACGSCRDAIARYGLAGQPGGELGHQDLVQWLVGRLPARVFAQGQRILYHASCHAAWVGANKGKAGEMYRAALAEFTGADVAMSPGCCGESGMGAMTSPAIYNRLRQRKRARLMVDLAPYDSGVPVVTGCPSCKVGLSRILMQEKDKRPVLHTVEWLAEAEGGVDWRSAWRKRLNASATAPVRVVDVDN